MYMPFYTLVQNFKNKKEMLGCFVDSFLCVIFAPNKWTYDYDNKYCKSDL